MRISKGGIAFFDSGIGGLTVLAECQKRFPQETFYYYGDNAHAPYGNLPPQIIRRYVYKAFKRFRRLRVKAAVIACNTATAVCVEELRKKFTFPIVGAEPAVALAARKGGQTLVLTTRATYESERFQKLCARVQERFPASEIIAVPCEMLAGEIETHLLDEEYDFTPSFPPYAPNAVVLGCTHYIYIKEIIKTFYGCPTYDGNAGIAARLENILDNVDENTPQNRNFKKKNKMFARGQEKMVGESRPHLSLLRKKFLFLGFFTAICSFLARRKNIKTNKNTNKRSHQKIKKCQKLTKKEHFFTIFFLGRQKKVNKSVYKQMFGCILE